MKHFILLLLLSSIFFFPAGIIAQEDQSEEDIADFSLEDLLDVKIVSASKFSQKQNEAPSVISVITSDQIDGYGWLSINEILGKLPGFAPSRDYDRRTVSSRGLFEGWNNNHLSLLVDGIPFNDNLYGSAYTWEITPLFFVKSLEIIRGPGSALYGSNATNGVITINTLNAEDLKEKSMFRFRYGNDNTQIYDIVAGSKGKHMSFVLGFNHQTTEGNSYMSYDGSARMDGSSLMKLKVRDDRSSNYFFGKITGENSLKGLTLQLHRQDWEYQTGHGWLWMIPDMADSMKESRTILSLQYKPEAKKNFHHEYMIRYQKHDIDWNVQYYHAGSFDNFYPGGVSEYLKTKAEDIFARAQFTFQFDNKATLLFGVETSIFFYGGDKEHYSNTDLNVTYAPYPNGKMTAHGPWLEWIEDEPLKNFAVFGQFTSGDLLGKKLKATLGLRFDTQWFDFNALDKAGKPKDDKSFKRFSPRLGLVYLVNDRLSFKALAGKAFRAPSPTEMFGANTWTLGSNIRELKPETITTYEIAMDWRLNKKLNWRLNWFHTKFENQIAYSVANNNLSTNVYTLTNMGFESELMFGFSHFTGFVNYSFVKRLDEKIIDKFITENTDDVTWAPAHTFNFGLTYRADKFKASVQGHYQGEVKRRASDSADATFATYRGSKVKAWFSVDINLGYEATKAVEIGLTVKNLFDSKNYLIKNFSYPFDYRMQGVKIYGNLTIKL